MKSKKAELLVGVFVALTIAAGLMLALNVANQSMASSEDSYILYCKIFFNLFY